MKSHSKRICIVGCGGFIGSHLLEQFLEEPDLEIEGVDLRDEKIRHLFGKPGFTFHHRDIYEPGFVDEITARCDTIISLAAICHPSLYNKEPLKVMEASFQRPLEIVQSCSKKGVRLIHFSTCEVYGKTVSAVSNGCSLDEKMEEDTTHLIMGPISKERWIYASAKQLLERAIWAHGRHSNLDFTIVRPFNFIGPRMDFLPGIDGSGIPRVFACFMDSLLFGKPMILVNGGRNKRVFTYITDAAKAVLLMVRKPEAARGQIFNIGNPSNEISIQELAKKMRSLYPGLSGQPVPDRCTLTEKSGLKFYGQGYDDCDRRMPDIKRAVSSLGWKPKTGLDDTIKLSMAAFIEHYRAQ